VVSERSSSDIRNIYPQDAQRWASDHIQLQYLVVRKPTCDACMVLSVLSSSKRVETGTYRTGCFRSPAGLTMVSVLPWGLKRSIR
jgi:hypothetical protein